MLINVALAAVFILLIFLAAAPAFPIVKFLGQWVHKTCKHIRWRMINATRLEILIASLEAQKKPVQLSHPNKNWQLDVNGYKVHPKGPMIELEIPSSLNCPWLNIRDTRAPKCLEESTYPPYNATSPSEQTGDQTIDDRFIIQTNDLLLTALLTRRVRCLMKSFHLFELAPDRISAGGRFNQNTLDHMLEIADFLQNADPVAAVLENLSDPNLEVRRLNLKLIPLCDLEPQLMNQTLGPFLKDKDPLCRALAAKSLKIYDQEMMVALLQNPKLSQATAEVVMEILKSNGEPSAFQLMRQLLSKKHISDHLLRNAADHLSRSKDAETIPFLRAAISRTEDPDTKAFLITALGRFNSPCGTFLMTCLEELSYYPSRVMLRTAGAQKKRDLIITILKTIGRRGDVDLIPHLRQWDKRMFRNYSTEVEEALIYIKAGIPDTGVGALAMADTPEQQGALTIAAHDTRGWLDLETNPTDPPSPADSHKSPKETNT